MWRRAADADQLRPADATIGAAVAGATFATTAAADDLASWLAFDLLRGFSSQIDRQYRADLVAILIVIIGARWVRQRHGEQGDLDY